MKKWIYIIAAFAFLALGAYAAVQKSRADSLSAQVSTQKESIATITEQSAAQVQLIERLGALEAVHCEIQFVVNNKAVFGSIKNGDYSQVADATLRYLRSELIESDTLVVTNKFKQQTNSNYQQLKQ
jgi:hypothetical protein